MKLRTIGMTVVAAIALVAGSAQAQDAGWDTKYGILFTLPNPLGGASGTNVFNDYDGYVGFQYNLNPQAGIRIGADLVTNFCGRIEATDTANVTTKDVCTSIPGVNPLGYNSELGIKLQAEYMMRMSTAAVAPYVGVGANILIDRKGLSGTNEDSSTPTKTDFKNSETAFGLGVGAKAGLEWRVHKVIALFAEYKADLTLITRTSYKVDMRTTGSPTQTAKGSQNSYGILDTGIAHFGQLGLVAFF